MLNVPQEVKDLLHLDTCQKNIRIHFPNGERQDICNDLIVKDSVKFTESLCSQDTLKFGLAESPVFECETVGVGNIKGAKIEVFCEVFCDSTVTGAEWKNDLMSYVYAIPYGSFYVASCKRQADIIHRQITAYGGFVIDVNDNPILNAKYMNPCPGTAVNYSPNVFYTILMGGQFTGRYSDATYTEAAVPGSGPTTWTYIDDNVVFPLSDGYLKFKIMSVVCNIGDANTIHFADYTRPNYTLDEIIGQFETYFNLTPGLPYWKPLGNIALFGAGLLMFPTPDPYNYTFVPYAFQNGKYIYSYQFAFYSASQGAGLVGIPYAIIAERYNNNDVKTDEKQIDFRDWEEQKLYTVSFPASYPTEKMTVARKLAPNSVGIYTIQDEIDYLGVFSEILETRGTFARVNRSNAIEFVDIRKQFGLNPNTTLFPGNAVVPQSSVGGQLLPNDYQTCWYDDEYIRKFGMIRVEYKDSSDHADHTYDYVFSWVDSTAQSSKDFSVYDLSGNQWIKDTERSFASIYSICQALEQILLACDYIPVEFVGRGLPYVEAGDTFEILTKSNDSITTIVLDRTIGGEQTLTDTYKSSGGSDQLYKIKPFDMAYITNPN